MASMLRWCPLVLSLAGCAALNHAPPRDPSLVAHPAPWRAGAAAAPDASPAAALAPRRLRAVTYNLHGISGELTARALREDPATAQADLLLLQEVDSRGACSAACAAGKELGFASLYAPGHQQDGGTSGVAILSRWPLRDPQVIELPYQHAVINSARRIALAATVDTAAGPLRVISVHLENRISPAARVAQLAPVLGHARRFEGAVLIGGDMNTSPFSWLLHLLPIPTGAQDDRLNAAVRAAGLQTPVSKGRPTSKWLNMRLDAIYTRGLQAGASGVATSVRASDHLPLWLSVVVQEPPVKTAGP
ncbi:MAG TPA: endonuclease/exonuclease/phosphatase family protein [Kofleriaceae bacterium]|nr:endonuclease/exonuclease/phosphatase family protein [Kofleriaceae bacterium]